MYQRQIFVIVLNSATVFFAFSLIGIKNSASRSEECNNRATGQEKTRLLFSYVYFKQ